MSKLKVLWVGDAPDCGSGFAEVTKGLGHALSQDFDMYCFGINSGFAKYDHTKWKHIYPVQNPKMDPYGTDQIVSVMHDLKPDVIFLNNDYFVVAQWLNVISEALHQAMEQKIPLRLPPIVVYYPIDSEPMSSYYSGIRDTQMISQIVSYTAYANKVQDNADYPIISHAIDTAIYNKISKDQRRYAREKFNIPEKSFNILCVNDLSPRKNHYASFRAAKLLQEKYDDVSLTLHIPLMNRSMGPGPACNLSALIENSGWSAYDVKDGTIILTKKMGKIPDIDMKLLYATGDVFLTTAGGGGWELTPAQALSCELPIIVPDNTIFPEVHASKGTRYIPCPHDFILPSDNAHRRYFPNVEDTFKALEESYLEWNENGKSTVFNPDGREQISRFSWAEGAKDLKEIFERVVKERKELEKKIYEEKLKQSNQE